MIDKNKNHGAVAEELFRQGCNCSQAVVAAFEDVTGFDRDTSLKAASALGGGMCRMREVCGAVSGAMIVLGMAMGDGADSDHAKKTALYKVGQEFAESFKQEFGSIVCRELLGLPDGKSDATPEARTDSYYKKRPCAEIVRLAAETLEKII
ncbi:MAG: C_GCAxxG_C_C family protein [Clostridia bacterium]|nr:C_GCAxxG_C_C family protein [Clostridia bacterium]